MNDDTLITSGTESASGGTTTTFSDVDTSSDEYTVDENDPGEWIADIGVDTGDTTTMEGSVGTNSVGSSSYAYETIEGSDAIETSSGSTPSGDFSSYQSSTEGFIEVISNPPPTTTTYSWTVTTSYTQSTYFPDLGALPEPDSGPGDLGGSGVAESVGSFPLPRGSAAGGAIHDGTTQPALDTSDGLVSAIAGQDLHAIEFSGAEIGITVSGTSINLEEENEADPEDGSTPWVSHPATIGYSREGTSHTAVAP